MLTGRDKNDYESMEEQPLPDKPPKYDCHVHLESSLMSR